LTSAEVEEFFPKKQFENIKTSFPQSKYLLLFSSFKYFFSCSVCLDDFLKESECHQLYCEHIFHDVCIQKWLSKHDVRFFLY